MIKEGRVKKWVLGLVVLPVIVGAVLWVFRNPIATSGLERCGEALVGAEVSVKGVRVGPVSLDLAWEGLTIADARDPWKNLLETGPGRLRLAGPPLLHGCVVVESLTAEEVAVGGGRLVEARVRAGVSHDENQNELLSRWLRQRLESGAQRLPGLELEDGGSPERVHEVMGAVALRTPDRVGQARSVIQRRVARWRLRFRGHDFQRRIRAIGEALEAEESLRDESSEALAEMLAKAQGLRVELEGLKRAVRTERGAAAAEVARLNRWQAAYRRWVTEDAEGAVALAHLDARGLQKVAEALFSHPLGGVMIPLIETLENLNALACGVEEAPEPAGAAPRPWPRLWVKRAVVGVVSGDVRLHGRVTGFSSHQAKAGEPLRFFLEGEAAVGAGQLGANGEISCPDGACRHTGELRAEGVPCGAVALAPGISLAGGMADLQASYRFDGSTSRVASQVTVAGLKVAGEGGGAPWFRQALGEALGRVPALELRSTMALGEGQGRWDLASNLDAYLAVRFDEAVARETARLKQGVQTEVKRRLRGDGMVLGEDLAMAQQALLAPLDALEHDLRREEQALRRFVAGVKKERRKRQKIIEEKGMEALMRMKF